MCVPPQDLGDGTAAGRTPVTLRLVIPASQCGSLIGKAGTKIREIREVRSPSTMQEHGVPPPFPAKSHSPPVFSPELRGSGAGGWRPAAQLHRARRHRLGGAGHHHPVCEADLCRHPGGTGSWLTVLWEVWCGLGGPWPHCSSPPPPFLPVQSPPKGATIPYHPGLSLGTILLSANQVRGTGAGGPPVCMGTGPCVVPS